VLNATVYQHYSAATEKSTSAAVRRYKSRPGADRLQIWDKSEQCWSRNGPTPQSNVECSGQSTFFRKCLVNLSRPKCRSAAEMPEPMIRKRWGRAVSPSARGLCRATAAGRWDESRSSTACSSHPGDGTRPPNLSQNSSGWCTSWWARTRRRSRGSPTEITPQQIKVQLRISLSSGFAGLIRLH